MTAREWTEMDIEDLKSAVEQGCSIEEIVLQKTS
jgi:hypothetical protein